MDRKEFLRKTGYGSLWFPFRFINRGNQSSGDTDDLFFDISLAQWSLHKSYFGKSLDDGWDRFWNSFQSDPNAVLQGDLDPLYFSKTAKQEFGISTIEYVNTFYFGKIGNQSYIKELKNIADGEGVKSHLIMCDREGSLGHPSAQIRKKVVENHFKWVGMAKFLGCSSIRVNAYSQGTYNEQIKYISDGLHELCEFCSPYDINVLVENHGGLSSNGKWLRELVNRVDHPLIGTLPDFGNFTISENNKYDRYLGVRELMPFAKGVSAKSYNFDADGYETTIDYHKMLEIVNNFDFRGNIGIEYEGDVLHEKDGILATKRLLEQVGSKFNN